MTSQYETKRLITFDRIKIKSDYKYLLNTKVKFNEMFHSRSGKVSIRRNAPFTL